MKKVLSVSIGSSTRDHRVETTIMGQDFILERKGTDGDIKKAIELIRNTTARLTPLGWEVLTFTYAVETGAI